VSPEPVPGVRSPWPVAAWAMVALTVLAIWVAIGGDILSPVVVLDVLALWPVAAPAVLLLAVGWLRRKKSSRGLAMAPLLVVTWLLLALGLYLGEWDRLPSAVADVTGGPVAGVGVADLSLEVEEGAVSMRAEASDSLYAIHLPRSGGPTGPPDVVVVAGDGRTEIIAVEGFDSRWYRFSGWDVTLDPTPRWNLRLRGNDIEADATGLDLGRLDLEGAGRARIGSAGEDTSVLVDGRFTVTVPVGAAVEVIGAAEVPEGWQQTETGFLSNGTGPAITIQVEDGSSVRIVIG
jgi:hypothetical protein